MRPNTTKQKLREGRPVFGAIIGEYAPVALELTGALGFDFVMIDCEHGSMTLDQVENLVRASEAFNLTPIARVPDHDPSTILRFLDRGVQGIIVPHVNTVDQATAVTRAARYYPEGERSIGSTRAHDYYVGITRSEAAKFLNEHVLVIPMIEHIDAVRNMDDILKVPGIDVVHIAANDLAQSMGFPPEAEVRAKLMEAISKARAAGIPAGVGGNDPANASAVAELVREGATFVTLSVLGLLRLGIDTFRRQYDSAQQKS